MALIIRTNASQGTIVLIKDIGIYIPASGGSETFTTIKETAGLKLSKDLRTYAIDNAFGAGSSTLIVNDGVRDIPQAEVDAYLSGYPVTDIQYSAKEPNGFIDQTSSSINFVNGTRTFSISVKSPATSFSYLVKGIKYTKTTTDSVIITNTEGIWFIYYSGSTLTASQTFPGFDAVLVSILYWDATNSKQITYSDERHGCAMAWTTHRRLNLNGLTISSASNFTIGNYILRGDGSSNAHSQFSLADGQIYDEDLTFSVVNSASPANPFEQILSTIAKIPMFYRSGTTAWRRIDATDYAMSYDGTNPIKYNLNTGGSWSLTNATNDWFINTWIFATTDPNNPIVGIIGQTQRQTSAVEPTAYTDIIKNGLPFAEYAPLYRLSFRTNTTYTNATKAILHSFSNLNAAPISTDRYTFLASYNGVAGAGKYLDIAPGQSSGTAPFTFPETSFIRTMIIHCTASSTGTVSLYKLPNLTNAVITISLAAQTDKRQDYSAYFSADEQIALKVSSGSLAKPSVTAWIQTDVTTV